MKAEEELVVTTSGFAATTNLDVDDNIKNALNLFLGENKSEVEGMLKRGAVIDLGFYRSNYVSYSFRLMILRLDSTITYIKCVFRNFSPLLALVPY